MVWKNKALKIFWQVNSKFKLRKINSKKWIVKGRRRTQRIIKDQSNQKDSFLSQELVLRVSNNNWNILVGKAHKPIFTRKWWLNFNQKFQDDKYGRLRLFFNIMLRMKWSIFLLNDGVKRIVSFPWRYNVKKICTTNIFPESFEESNNTIWDWIHINIPSAWEPEISWAFIWQRGIEPTQTNVKQLIKWMHSPQGNKWWNYTTIILKLVQYALPFHNLLKKEVWSKCTLEFQ